jgi:hypothetical protein
MQPPPSMQMTASFNGKPLLLTSNTQKEETKSGKMITAPFSGTENAEEEASKRRMRQEKYTQQQ